MYPFIVKCEACVRKYIWSYCIKRWSVRRVIALQTETAVLVAKAIFLHNYLRQNSAAGLLCIINRMASVAVWE